MKSILIAQYKYKTMQKEQYPLSVYMCCESLRRLGVNSRCVCASEKYLQGVCDTF